MSCLLVVLCLLVVWYFYARFSHVDVNQGVSSSARQYTSFQEQIKTEYDAAKGTFTGDQSEVELVAKYFATNVFTLWGVMSDDDYNGKDMISEAHMKDFDQQMKNNLVFQFYQIVSNYGAKNLPIVTNVDVDDVRAVRIIYDSNYYKGYSTEVIMTYQDGTVAGTTNDNVELAGRLLENWAHSADLEFFWLPAEEGDGGEWKLASMKNLISNEQVKNDNDEGEL